MSLLDELKKLKSGGSINKLYIDNSLIFQVPSGSKNITGNGNNIDVTNIKTVNVAVPASAVTSGTLDVDANGTYDVTNKKSVKVNISAKLKDWAILEGVNDYTRYGCQIADSNGNVERIFSGTRGIYTLSYSGANNHHVKFTTSVAGTYYYSYSGLNGRGTATVNVQAGGTIVEYDTSQHSASCRFCYIIKIG